MVVLGVLLEMIGQAVDALGEQRDLHLGRARVALVGAELLDQSLFPVDGKRHRTPLQSPRPREPTLHTGAGSQKSFYCQGIRSEGTTRWCRSKDNRKPGHEPRRAAATSRAICWRSASTFGNFFSSLSRVRKVREIRRSYRSPEKSRI